MRLIELGAKNNTITNALNSIHNYILTSLNAKNLSDIVVADLKDILKLQQNCAPLESLYGDVLSYINTGNVDNMARVNPHNASAAIGQLAHFLSSKADFSGLMAIDFSNLSRSTPSNYKVKVRLYFYRFNNDGKIIIGYFFQDTQSPFRVPNLFAITNNQDLEHRINSLASDYCNCGYIVGENQFINFIIAIQGIINTRHSDRNINFPIVLDNTQLFDLDYKEAAIGTIYQSNKRTYLVTLERGDDELSFFSEFDNYLPALFPKGEKEDIFNRLSLMLKVAKGDDSRTYQGADDYREYDENDQIKVVDNTEKSNTIKPSTTKQIKETKTMNILSNLVSSNKQAIATSAKLELGRAVNTSTKKLIIKQIKNPIVKMYADSPVFDLVVANLFKVAVDQYLSNNRLAKVAAENAVQSATYEILRDLDIPKLLESILSGATQGIDIDEVLDVEKENTIDLKKYEE